MKVEIQVTVELNGKPHVLSYAQAKALFEALKPIFDRPVLYSDPYRPPLYYRGMGAAISDRLSMSQNSAEAAPAADGVRVWCSEGTVAK